MEKSPLEYLREGYANQEDKNNDVKPPEETGEFATGSEDPFYLLRKAYQEKEKK